MDRFFLTTTTDDNGELCDDLYPGVVPGIFGKILKRRCRFQLAGGRLPIWAKCFMGSQLDCREFWLLHRIVAIGVTLQDYE